MLNARIRQVLSFKMMSFTVNLSIVIAGKWCGFACK